MSHGDLAGLLHDLRQAARTGSDLSAAPAADAARLLHLHPACCLPHAGR